MHHSKNKKGRLHGSFPMPPRPMAAKGTSVEVRKYRFSCRRVDSPQVLNGQGIRGTEVLSSGRKTKVSTVLRPGVKHGIKKRAIFRVSKSYT